GFRTLHHPHKQKGTNAPHPRLMFVGDEGFGHRYFSAEKFRDPASATHDYMGTPLAAFEPLIICTNKKARMLRIRA
ncbi:MAG: hypothetical protein ACYCZ7_02285, partial [Minisyncoccota bacterium]